MKWNNPEIKRPKVGDKIIFEDTVGLYMGVYESTKNGMIAVNGNHRDLVNWEDIFQWILYPEDY